MNPRAPRRPPRHCACRPGCLAPIVPGDQVNNAGVLVDHAAAAAAFPVDRPTVVSSPLSPRLRGAGGVPKRL